MITRLLLLFLLASCLGKDKPPVPATDRCAGCDMGTHHPGQDVAGCNCASCGSGTGRG